VAWIGEVRETKSGLLAKLPRQLPRTGRITRQCRENLHQISIWVIRKWLVLVRALRVWTLIMFSLGPQFCLQFRCQSNSCGSNWIAGMRTRQCIRKVYSATIFAVEHRKIVQIVKRDGIIGSKNQQSFKKGTCLDSSITGLKQARCEVADCSNI